jgi:ribosomal protein L25 (general stress protein Ctc)
MSNLQELKTSERDTTVTPHQLRTAGYTPASVYGQGIESQSIQIRTREFYHAFLQGQREFSLNGYVSGSAKVKHLARNPVTQHPIAVEFHLQSGSATTGKK